MRVKSSSFNPVDAKTRNGGPGRKVVLPKVPGGEAVVQVIGLVFTSGLYE